MAVYQRAGEDALGPTLRALAKAVLVNNKLGPIVFLTPELGKWSTVGGAFATPCAFYYVCASVKVRCNCCAVQ